MDTRIKKVLMTIMVNNEIHQQYGFLLLGQLLTIDFVQSLKPEDQEVAYGLNRRTIIRIN
jgi:hypothetical protein